jgi:hypothetical protein
MFKTLLLASSAIVLLASCSRSDKSSESGVNPNKARLQIYLTDDPAAYDEVWIDIKEIKINMSNDTVNGWQTLPGVAAGQYDLLRLVNDDDTLLAQVDLNPGRVEQIRLVLGPNNFVKIGNDMIPLETPSAQQSGLKLNIHHDVSAGILYTLLMDFDVAKSIVKTGNDRYILKPVIRTVLQAAGGTLQGYVRPFNFPTAILVFRGPNDTVTSTYQDAGDGGYRVRGLSANTYSLHFIPSDTTYRDTVITGINVNTGLVTVVDTMFLQQ